MDTDQILLRLPRHHIALLCSIVEGYEGVAIVRTLDAGQGLLELLIAPDFRATVLALLHVLVEDMELCLIDVGDHDPTA